jgi:hypothetical protein
VAYPLPFPRATFTGEVASLAPPTVTARGDLWAIGFSLGGSAPAECLLGRRALGDRGTITDLGDASRSRFTLRVRSVTEIATRPPLPALFLTIHRALGAVKVAAYRRDPALALVCVQPGPAPPAAFDDVVARLAVSLRDAAAAPGGEIWSCVVDTDDGSTGWERTERTVSASGTTLRTIAMLAYKDGDDVDLLEVDQREQADASGRLTSLSSLRVVNGAADLRTHLTRLEGARYQYDVTFKGGHVAGTFTSADPRGLNGTLAFADRIKTELLTGHAQDLKVEVYDPFESPDAPTARHYRLEAPGGRRVVVTTGTRTSHEMVDENGFSLASDYELSSGDMLHQTCTPERPRR